jgi:predicted DNA-binding WGR domain protein
VLTWTRVENWNDSPAKFVELAMEGSALWVRRGFVKAGRPPLVERKTFDTRDDAEHALASELARLRRRKFDEEKTFEGTAPAPRDLDRKADRALEKGSSRWSPAEARSKKQAFFERVRAAGIDPATPFTLQASPGGRSGSEAGIARDRDADARASTVLGIAQQILGVTVALTSEQIHDGRALRTVFESPEAIFQIARRKPR